MLKMTVNSAIRANVRAPKSGFLCVVAGTLAVLVASCASDPADSTVTGGGAGMAGTAGTAAGTAGTAGTAGAGGAGGSSGTAGTAGTGTGGTPPTCGYAAIIQLQCAKAGCHNTAYHSADLDLQAPGYEQRIVNAPATFGDISCPDPNGGALPVECIPPECAPFAGKKLIDTTTPSESWMLKKLLGTHTGCGDKMPLLPGKVTAEEQACLESWIHYLAGG